MLLEDKNAVIHGAGDAIGGAGHRAFARERGRVENLVATKDSLT